MLGSAWSVSNAETRRFQQLNEALRCHLNQPLKVATKKTNKTKQTKNKNKKQAKIKQTRKRCWETKHPQNCMNNFTEKPSRCWDRGCALCATTWSDPNGAEQAGSPGNTSQPIHACDANSLRQLFSLAPPSFHH